MGSKRQRRNFTPDEKAKLVRRHLVDKVPVSELCNEAKLQPSVFYDWLRLLLERAPQVLAAAPRGQNAEKQLEQKVEALEERLKKKDAVIAEISEEYVRLKKQLGEL
jgi:transposase-like protein